MKKVFFFKSSSHGREVCDISPATRDKKHFTVEIQRKTVGKNTVNSENVENNFRNFPVPDKKVTERKTISRSFVLRRSRSLSMSSASDSNARFVEGNLTGLRNQRKFPSSNGSVSGPLCDCSDCHYQLKPRDSKPERSMAASSYDLCDRACLRPSNSTSPRSSFCSTSIPGQVLDLYIDGEHNQETKLGIKSRNCATDISNSLRAETRHESPRKLAKDVVERLLTMRQAKDSKSNDICPNWPPMPTTSCDKHLDGQISSTLRDMSGKVPSCKDINDEETLGLKNHHRFFERGYETDLALRRKLAETKERAMLLSRELAEERSFKYFSGNISALSQKIRNLMEEERKLVLEISDHLQGRIAERAAAKEAVSVVMEEMNLASVKLEREKDELKSQLQKEWAIELRQYQSEESRLRDRLGELVELNVALQREACGFYDKEKEYTDRLSRMEVHVEDLTTKMDVARSENGNLLKKLPEIQDKLKVAEEVQSSMERNYREKEKENAELIKVVARLQETCSDQERTIDGLRQCLNVEVERKQSSGELESFTRKLQMEQLRLTGVEQWVRRQLESSRVESESLRRENIYLLERLKGTGKVGCPSAIKLDQELVSCVQCLENMELSLVKESTELCEKLLGILENKIGSEDVLEAHSVVEYGLKVQRLWQGVERLTRSIGKVAFVLKEIAEPNEENERSRNLDTKVLEDDLKSELKAESLLTGILKEKLYFKEKEVEQLQDELARALRNHEVLKTEIEGAFDTVSFVNHKTKNLELQMIKKDGTINQLQHEVRSQGEELAATRGILSKVTRERDLIWEEVKQYSEKNMLLNCEVNSMKKKIESLEEDALLKDGQISILKDSLNNARPFDDIVLFGSENGEDF